LIRYFASWTSRLPGGRRPGSRRLTVIGQASSATWGESAQSLVRRYAYGGILLFALLVLWWGVEGPYPLEYVSNGLYVLMLAVIIGLEIWIPYTPSWGDIRKASRADVTYFLLAAPLDALQMFLLVGLVAGTAQYHHYIQVFDIWPTGAPVLLQLLLVTLIVDVAKYWYHRWTHEVPLLWRYHSIHHSLDRLEMLRASYFYPIDIFLTVGIGTLAMIAFGVGHEIIIFHNVYAGITGLLNHSNADLRCGFFDHFLNSIGHHRAHHSVGLPGSQSNYGSFFNLADRMFGTRYLPEDQSSFEPLGLDETYDMPDTVLKQLAVPFRWQRIHRAP
jgi:sterol desaturase/sphingolipid hydroxylase (fatty acid hydroxylase superfamily)